MKKLFLLLFIISLNTYGQDDAWVYFNSKVNVSTFLNNPLQMLTQRSIDRRQLQNIALDFRDVPINQTFVDQIEAANGITVMAKSKWLNAVHIRGSIVNINALTSFSFVSSVVFANKLLNTNSAGRLNLIQHNNKNNETTTTFNYGSSNTQISMLNGHLLHQQNYTGTGKIIAVLDSGFPGVNTAAPFNRLITNNLILGGYNYVDRNTNFYSQNSHGTLVLSTMGGFVQNQLVGTAPDASYYLFVTEDAATENPIEESLWVEAAETADSLGVDIINTSLGYFSYDNPNYSHTYNDMDGNTTFISRGANIAFSRGMIVVVSGGNSGGTSNPHIASPADATNVLTVGAVNATEQYASFSSIGPSFDGRVKPDVVAMGVNSIVSNTQGALVGANGTSFSAPITCGLVACLWQALPNKTNLQIMNLIRSTSDRFNLPTPQFGFGVPDFNLALNSALGIPESSKNDFSVFPNPTSDILNISSNFQNKDVNFQLYDVMGKKVHEKDFDNDIKINVSALSKGIYFYKIEDKLVTKTGKIIKK